MLGAKRSEETKLAIKLYQDAKATNRAMTIELAATMAGINPSTLYRALFPNGKRKHEKELALRK